MRAFDVLGWHVEPESLKISRGEEMHHLPNKVMQLLCLLAARQGQVVSHEDIEAAIWDGNSFVARKAATNALWHLRKLMQEGDDPASFVETIPRRGYRLNPAVRWAEAPASRPVRHNMMSFGMAGGALVVCALVAALFLLSRDPAHEFSREILTDYPGEETEPALSADGRKLAFVWAGRGRDPDIYWKYLDEPGVPPRQVTATADDDAAPTWSPDGERLAYLRIDVESRDCEVYVHTLASGTNEKLADCQATLPGTLAWSPGGAWLAFAYRDDRNHGIALLDVKTRDWRQMTVSPRHDYPDTDVVWAPDGSAFAFTRRTVVETDEIHIMSLEGDSRHLADAPTDLYGIAWSSVADELIVAAVPEGEHRRQLVRLDLQTGKPLGLLEQGALEAYVPDMARRAGLLAYDASNFVVSVGLVTQGSEQVAPYHAAGSLSTDREPHISPDGKKLVFTSTRTGAKEVWMHREGAQVPRQLTSLGVSSVFAPRWAPDNRHVAFLAPAAHDRLQIHLLDTETGHLVALTNGASDHMPPNWAPDGRSILAAEQLEGAWTIHRYQLAPDMSLSSVVPLARGYVAQQDPAGRLFVYRLDDEAVFLVEGGEERLFLDGFERRDWGNWAVGDGGLYAVLRDEQGDRLEWVPVGTGEARTTIARVPLSLIMDQNSLAYDAARGRFFVAYYAMQQADIFGLRRVEQD